MFTLGILYLFLYCLAILGLFLLSFSQMPISALTQWSIPSFFFYLNRYSKFKQLWLILFFSLTGLPPVGLFFIKFNIIAVVIYQAHVVMFVVIFFLFFLNMLYYVQVYSFKNTQKDMYTLINNEIFKLYKRSLFSYKYNESYKLFKLIFYLIFIIILSTVFMFIFSDIFFLFSL